MGEKELNKVFFVPVKSQGQADLNHTFIRQVSLVQWSSRLLYTQKVAGSNPAGNINIRFGEERSNRHVLGIKYGCWIFIKMEGGGDECRIYNDDSLQINLEGFPSLQLTFYHTEKADVKRSSQKMAPHVQVGCIHLQWPH